MKKPLRYMLSVMLMLALMLSMGTAAFADKTDSELPVEYVTYGVGLPDAPGVDRHELGDDDITIDGVSWRTKTSEDKLYVYVLDLAAAKRSSSPITAEKPSPSTERIRRWKTAASRSGPEATTLLLTVEM